MVIIPVFPCCEEADDDVDADDDGAAVLGSVYPESYQIKIIIINRNYYNYSLHKQYNTYYVHLFLNDEYNTLDKDDFDAGYFSDLDPFVCKTRLDSNNILSKLK